MLSIATRDDILTSNARKFLYWLAYSKGPVSQCVNAHAADLAVRWRTQGSTRKQKVYDTNRWLEHEIQDAWVLQRRSSDNLILKAGAEKLLLALPDRRIVNPHPIIEYILSVY